MYRYTAIARKETNKPLLIEVWGRYKQGTNKSTPPIPKAAVHYKSAPILMGLQKEIKKNKAGRTQIEVHPPPPPEAVVAISAPALL